MNKKQKELVDTYFRKRDILSKRDYGDFEFHENEYLINNKKKPIIRGLNDEELNFLVNPKSLIRKLETNDDEFLRDKFITYFLIFHPNFIDYLPVNDLGSMNIGILLKKHPQLIDKLPVRNLGGFSVGQIIKHQPTLVDKLPLNYLDGWDLRQIILREPTLVEKLPINKLDGRDIIYILSEIPSLIDNLPIENLSIYEIEHILEYYPTFRPLFKERGLIK
jgi:hypothetical protein